MGNPPPQPHAPHCPQHQHLLGLTLDAALRPPNPGTEDTKGGSSLTETPPSSPVMRPHPHLDSPYLDARRGLVQCPGDFGAELHHGDRYHRQGDLPASATPSLMAGSVIKSWDTASLLCHLLPCLLCREPGCKPPLHRAARGEGTPSTAVSGLWAHRWGCHPLSLAGTAANGSVPGFRVHRRRVL